ncbi:MAG: DUF4332 domain-containing protein, partial [Planctomycetota bacterium]
MRLVNLDVDRPGNQQRCHIGPMSPGLNAIYGPTGSGKSTLLRWLRIIASEVRSEALAAETQFSSVANSAPIAGVLELFNRGSAYRVTTDRNGRIRFDLTSSHFQDDFMEYEQRWDGRLDARGQNSNLTQTQRTAFSEMAAAQGQFDTESALQQLAQKLGLTQELPTSTGSDEALQRREHELRARLLQLEALEQGKGTLLSRQRHLEAELETAQLRGQTLRYEGQNIDSHRLDGRQQALEADLNNALREIEVVDHELATCQRELKMLEVDNSTHMVGESYRAQLQALDDRLNRWRQTLKDLKAHRESVEQNATDVQLDQQIGDQFSSTKEPDPRAAMRSLEAQIQGTRRQLDLLVERYTSIPGYDHRSATAAVSGTGFRPNEVPNSHGVYRDPNGHTFVGHPNYLPDSSMLPETLRSMQKDLHEVCQQLSRHEAKSASERLQQQSQQLARCEVEMLHSVERLIEERAELLQCIASEHHLSVEQLTLAFGNWCQCHDHPHLHDWLLSEESSCPTAKSANSPEVRQRLLDEIAMLEQRRRDASVHADLLRRQLKEADIYRRGVVSHSVEPAVRNIADIQLDLQRVSTDLATLAERDRIELELAALRSNTGSPPTVLHIDSFAQATDKHITGLMGNASAPVQGHVPKRNYDMVDGMRSAHPFVSNRREVPREIVRLAMRLAICELLAARGEEVCLVMDNALESVSSEVQAASVQHLSQVAAKPQQLVLLTNNSRVAELVRQHHGFVTSLDVTVVPDANQHLMALANDEESDKWHQFQSFPVQRRDDPVYYLTPSSLVEDLPAIDPEIAARCRNQGVDRIGDLLDVDPLWLADQICIDGVSRATVETWQTIAHLLCTVPNLRPFDARVMVGAGIRSARELQSMPPSRLLDRVESFLASDLGRRVLRSGSSYELTRLTTWIASAKGQGEVPSYLAELEQLREDRQGRYTRRDGYSRSGRDGYSRSGRDGYSRSGRDGDSSGMRGQSGSSYESRSRNRSRSSRSNRSGRNYERTAREFARADHEYERANRDYERADRDYDRDYERTERDLERAERQLQRTERDYESRSRRSSKRDPNRGSPSHESSRGQASRAATHSARSSAADSTSDKTVGSSMTGTSQEASEAKFYLELASPVVDAPSIGPKMSEHLEACGIEWIEQLLAAEPEQLAEELDHRRVNADTIRDWQHQAGLVCRIPNLRGHDAQFLVACEYTTPEDIVDLDAENVLAQVTELIQTKEGQRILRGGKEPDLEEVTD